MRSFLQIPFFYFLLFSVTAHSQSRNILEDYNLKGKVKSIAAHEWLIRDGNPVKRTIGIGLMNKVTTLNKKGQVVSSFDIDSTTGKKGYAIAYDTSGKRTSFTRYGQQITTVRYEYEQPHPGKRITFEMDAKGQRSKIREEVLASNGQTLEMTEYFQESPINTFQDGKWTEEAPTEHIQLNRNIYIYSEKGKLVEESDYKNDTLQYHAVMTYDHEGHLTGQTTEWHDGRKEMGSWNWKKGIKTQGIRILYDKDQKKKSTSYFYDNAGHVIRELQADHTSNTSSATMYEYTFDKNGNWTQRKMYRMEDGKKTLMYTVDRTITYFTE